MEMACPGRKPTWRKIDPREVKKDRLLTMP
jgi:hypothetical protein